MNVYMFAMAMAGIYIHKASNKYVILALAMLLYLSFFLFFLLFNGLPSLNNIKSTSSYAIEMNSDWNSNKNSQFIERIRKDQLTTNFVNYKFKDKNDEWNKLSKQLNSSLTENPLNDIFIIETFAALENEQSSSLKKSNASIKSIHEIQKGSSQQSAFEADWKLLLLPLLILSLILYFNILQGATQSNLSSNKKLIESLIVAGAHHSKLTAVFRKNALLNVVFSLILAIILFLVTIYLIKTSFHLNINDFSVVISLKSILIPTLILLVLHSMIVLWKVDKYLKSI